MASSYTLNFSDPNKTNSITITGPVRDNYSTSLDLVGPGYISYGTAIAQDFLKLLENFASPNPPINPIEGQLWYDTSNPGRKILRVNNGSITSARWPSANGIYQQANDPSTEYSQNLIDGDLWVDTGTSQLKIRYGEDWTLVGPNLSTGANKTGSESVNLVSNTNETYPVILNWVNGKVVEIISYNSFTPRTVIDGFPSLSPGINITTRVAAKYNGLADRAKVLEISNGVYVQASEVMKNVWPASLSEGQRHSGSLIVESPQGLYVRKSNTPIRTNKEIKIAVSTSSNTALVQYLFPEGSLEVGIPNKSYIYFDGDAQKVGINTSNNTGTLTINGTAYINGAVTATGSLYVTGSAAITGNTEIAGKLNVTGVTTLSNFVTVAKNIVPSMSNVILGSEAMPFDRIYVNTIGTPETNFVGYITTATTLETARNFQITGQMNTVAPGSFNGASNVTLVTTASSTLISAQSVTDSTTATQTLMVLNTASGAPAVLEKISKRDFLADVYSSMFQTGMIVPSGTSTSYTGFLLCDGSPKLKSAYQNLFNVIRDNYTTATTAVSDFNVPRLTTATVSGYNGYPIFYHIKT